MAHPNKLANARVLVFGGTSGMGFATANLCASQGAYVYISSSNQARIDASIAKIQSYYPDLPKDRLAGYACDLADTDNLEANLTALFDRVTDNGANKINHIAFTAGDVFSLPKISEVTVENVIAIGRVRVLGAIFIAKLISHGKYMPKDLKSSITLTGGVNTVKPAPGFTLGAANGGTLQGLMRGLAVELAPIRVNLVEPGAIKTELLDRAVENFGQHVLDKWSNMSLTKTVGDPADTAEAFAYLMRDAFATGSIVETNGGYLLS